MSVPTGSEDFGAKNQRLNQYEEALFKCEDDRYEMDMVMDANRSAIKALEPIAIAIKALEDQGKKDKAAQSISDSSLKANADDGSSKKYQYRLDKRALSVMHLKAIAVFTGMPVIESSNCSAKSCWRYTRDSFTTQAEGCRVGQGPPAA